MTPTTLLPQGKPRRRRFVRAGLIATRESQTRLWPIPVHPSTPRAIFRNRCGNGNAMSSVKFNGVWFNRRPQHASKNGSTTLRFLARL